MDENERGTYSPPTEDHLNYESRRGPPPRDQMPITLIASAIVLVVLLLAVVLFYNSGLNSRTAGDVGEPIANYKDGAIEEARPLADDDLLDPVLNEDAAMASATAPTFSEDTEAPQAREVISEAPAPVAPIKGPLNADGTLNDNVLPPANTTPAPKPVEATPPVASGGGAASVQIGAFGSRDIADREYAQIASSYGMFVGGTSKAVEKVDRDGKTFYRTSFSGFASKEKAKQFCDALMAAGKTCFVK